MELQKLTLLRDGLNVKNVGKPFGIHILSSCENLHCRKPYGCKGCGKVYLEASHCRKHGKAHTGEALSMFRIYSVYLHITCKSLLKRMIFLLSKNFIEEPCECKECGKSFTASTGLSQHVGLHTEVESYKCKKCGNPSLRAQAFVKMYQLTVERNPRM